MNSGGHNDGNATVAQSNFLYGWIIVAACTVLLTMQCAIMYSFGVFFKPLIADFGSSRAAISGVYSAFMLTNGAFAIPVGWLADRFGPAKVTAVSGLIAGLGLVLSSNVNSLWQLYLTYGILVGIGLCSGFPVATGTTARWFVKHRGLALGIVSAGTGLGTLVGLPVAEHLIAVFGWARAYFFLGLAAWVVMIVGALFLRRDPEAMGLRPYGVEDMLTEPDSNPNERIRDIPFETSTTLSGAARTRPLWILILIYFLFSISLQMIIVHLINYATDLGTAPFIAATLLSTVGMGSIAGRLVMGSVSDRIGSNNALILCCIILATSVLWLIFARALWMFYLFAIVFGFAYGGEVPQIPALIGRFFGLRAVAALVGTVILSIAMGGALGSWMGGQIFDVTHSYLLAFTVAVLASILSAIAAVLLKKIAR
ncbi:MFS transporter [Chloroflexota bacterium]